MESVREQHSLAQHPLVSGRELDLRDGEGVAQMQAAVHVGEGEVAEPLGELFADLGCAEALGFLLRRRVDLEDALFAPLLLVLFLKRGEVIALARLRSTVSIGPRVMHCTRTWAISMVALAFCAMVPCCLYWHTILQCRWQKRGKRRSAVILAGTKDYLRSIISAHPASKDTSLLDAVCSTRRWTRVTTD